MSYILRDPKEPQRLDQQSQIAEFSVERELSTLELDSVKTLLDAGCGSGVLCRHLEQRFSNLKVSGCDISESSLEYCRKHARREGTHFFRHNLLERPTDARFGVIVCRLVFHHLSLHQQRVMTRHLRLSLQAGGKLCLIDTDGLFLNLGTTSSSLLERMELVRQGFQGNLVSARYHPSLLAEAGFTNVRWEIVPMDFQGESRQLEVEQWRARFESALPFYIHLLGSELEARRFFRDYLEEAAKEHVALFYNKFIVTGVNRE